MVSSSSTPSSHVDDVILLLSARLEDADPACAHTAAVDPSRKIPDPPSAFPSMIERVPGYDFLEKCIKDILSLIQPVEDDRSKRLSAIQELEISIQSVPALRGAAAKPFGSFLSNLYSKSGDLDLSVQLMHSSNLQISKKRKQNLLRELRRTLQIRGDAGYLNFIPHARVPVLQYVSNRFGISCDLSIDNYPGRIKSRIFYWINTLDERFSDMVLLVKEWAKAQNINDPKTGTLNSYSLCLLVLFHFQTCEPAILPPLKDIYEGNITEDFADVALYNEQHLDEVCAANITKFQSQNKEEDNESSLCHLLATFFHKFSNISDLSSDVISTYTGQFEKIQDNPSRKAKSYSLFVEDPVERPDNAARAVGRKGLIQISHAFKDANRKFVSLEHTDRNDLLEMLCTPGVCSNLGGRVIAKPYANTPQRTNQHARSMGRGAAKPSDSGRHHVDRGFTGSRAVHNPRQTTGQSGQYQNHNLSQVHSNATVYQTPGQYQNHNLPKVHASTIGHQTTGQPGPYQNHNRQQAYTALHQAAGLYQNQSHPQVHAAWIQTGGPYQNRNNQQIYNTGHQTAGPYQNHSDPQGYTSGGLYQTPGRYQNFYNQTPLYMTRHQTEGPYQNQQARKYKPAPQPVLGGLQNGPAWNSSSQASSSHATWQERSHQHS